MVSNYICPNARLFRSIVQQPFLRFLFDPLHCVMLAMTPIDRIDFTAAPVSTILVSRGVAAGTPSSPNVGPAVWLWLLDKPTPEAQQALVADLLSSSGKESFISRSAQRSFSGHLLQMMPSSAGTSASTASASSHIPCTAMCSIATAMLSPSKSPPTCRARVLPCSAREDLAR